MKTGHRPIMSLWDKQLGKQLCSCSVVELHQKCLSSVDLQPDASPFVCKGDCLNQAAAALLNPYLSFKNVHACV